MKQYTREEIEKIVDKAYINNTKPYEPESSTGDDTIDAVRMIAGYIAQTHKNCANMIIDVLDEIFNEKNS